MSSQTDQTPAVAPEFNFSAFPPDTLFLDRRTLPGPNGPPLVDKGGHAGEAVPRARKERRRRVDPTTFEKQYSDNELEFMNAIQEFKNRSGKMFPSHDDILRVALRLGYRKPVGVDLADDNTSHDVANRSEVGTATLPC